MLLCGATAVTCYSFLPVGRYEIVETGIEMELGFACLTVRNL